MPSEIEKFQNDLLESVKQMKRGEAVRTTQVKLPEAAVARTNNGSFSVAVAHPEVLRELRT